MTTPLDYLKYEVEAVAAKYYANVVSLDNIYRVWFNVDGGVNVTIDIDTNTFTMTNHITQETDFSLRDLISTLYNQYLHIEDEIYDIVETARKANEGTVELG